MGEMNDAAVVGALRRAMTLAAAKQVVSASNLANANTPGYKAKELSFAAALDDQMTMPLATTHGGHISSASLTQPLADTQDVDGPARLDGNTVQIDRELLAMSRAGGEFARAQTALAAKFRLVKYAIQESR